jgi:hypothetical protein
MSAVIIDGKAATAELREEVTREVALLDEAPGLATLLVGDDPASEIYARNKRRLCVKAGMRDLHRHLPAEISQGELRCSPQLVSPELATTSGWECMTRMGLPTNYRRRTVVEADPGRLPPAFSWAR